MAAAPTRNPGSPGSEAGSPSPQGEPTSGIAAANGGGERPDTAKGGVAPAGAAAAVADEEPVPRPESAASSIESEPEYTAIRRRQDGKGGSAAAAPAAAAKQELLPPPSELAGSPFIDLEHPVTVSEGLKLVLMAPVVVLKLVVLALVIPYAWAILWVLLLGHTPQTPMQPFRSFLVRQWIHQWGRFLLFLSGFYCIPVRGWRNMRAAEECRAILVFNHPSYVDAAAIATFFTPSGVSKAGVANIPFIGLFGIALQVGARLACPACVAGDASPAPPSGGAAAQPLAQFAGCCPASACTGSSPAFAWAPQAPQLFFVERKGSGDRANRHVLRGDAVAAIAQRAADRRFPLLALAPEATTKAKPCLLRFRRGAFAPGQPVCPVLLRYRYRRFNPSWGVCFTPFHVYRLLAQFVNHLEIEVLPPYHPSDEELQDWALYAENVRQLMGRRLGVPLVDQGLAEERQLWRSGVRVGLLGDRVALPRQRQKAD